MKFLSTSVLERHNGIAYKAHESFGMIAECGFKPSLGTDWLGLWASHFLSHLSVAKELGQLQ